MLPGSSESDEEEEMEEDRFLVLLFRLNAGPLMEEVLEGTGRGFMPSEARMRFVSSIARSAMMAMS